MKEPSCGRLKMQLLSFWNANAVHFVAPFCDNLANLLMCVEYSAVEACGVKGRAVNSVRGSII